MFELKTELLENHEALLTIEVEEKASRDALQKAARRISRQINIPGFRKGKAPYHVVENTVGEETLRQEAVELLLEKLYPQALEQAEIEPYGPGDLEDVDAAKMSFTVRVPLRPVVELGDYEDLRLEPEPVEVTPEEVDEALEEVRAEHAILNLVERPAQLGDQLKLEYIEGRVGEDVILHEHDFTVVLDTEKPFISAEFIENLVGMEEEEEETFTLVLPSDLEHEELQGEEAEFEVVVAEVYERILPALDDALASTVGNYETLEELREVLRAELLEEKQAEAQTRYRQELVNQLVEMADIRYPPLMEEEEIDSILDEIREDMETRGQIAWEDFLRLQGTTEEMLKEQFRPRAQARLEQGLTLNKFAEVAGVEVEPEEVEALVEDQLLRFGLAEFKGKERAQLVAQLKRGAYAALMDERVMQRLERLAQGLPLVPEAEVEADAESETTAEALDES